MSRKEAKEASYAICVPAIIISIADIATNRNTFAPNPNIYSILHLKFNDESDLDKSAISVEQAKEIASFINVWKDMVKLIIVHCEAGVSRSSGVAAGIMKYINNDDMPIFENPRFLPNTTCYRKVLEAFGVEIDENELVNKEKRIIEAWQSFTET